MFDDERTPDDKLIHRWQEGHGREEVFAVLQRRYTLKLARLFRRMGFDDETCRDLGQETFMLAFRGLDSFRQSSSFQTWIFQIARNAARKKLRSGRTQKRAAEEVSWEEVRNGEPDLAHRSEPLHGNGGGDDPLNDLVTQETRRQVRAAVDELSPPDRVMVQLRIFQDRSVQEVAQILRKPEGTVKSGWSRVRNRLKEKLGPHVSDLPS